MPRMKKLAFALIVIVGFLLPQRVKTQEASRWDAHVRNTTITRDTWGIAHIHGKTDADAVFGMIYAQAEDDFNRVETNFLNGLGRLAEAEGEGEIRDRRCETGDARSERPCTFASRLSVSSLFFRLSISYL